MKIPLDSVVIDDRKLTEYLLVYKLEDDKSQYLAIAGYTLDTWEQLRIDLLTLVAEGDARQEKSNQYGTFYQIDGELDGINDRKLPVSTIWPYSEAEDVYRFITLKPRKRRDDEN